MIARLLLPVVASLVLLATGAQAQDGPSFDCHKASSRVEKVLCSGGNSDMGWIDRMMADLFKAALAQPGTDTNALRTAQRNWLAQRDRCTGSDDKIMSCLEHSYRARFVELASPWDSARLTGTYTAPNINGELSAVLFPDNSLAAAIDSNTGPPAYNLCMLELRATARGKGFSYAESTDSSDANAPVCKVTLTPGRSSLIVDDSGCSDYCGNGAAFDGTYKK